MYSPPKGPAGKKFIVAYAAEWRKVRKRETNSEQALIFPACILRKAKGVNRSAAIKRRILRRLALWESGQIAELVNDIVNAAKTGRGGQVSAPKTMTASPAGITRWSSRGSCGRRYDG